MVRKLRSSSEIRNVGILPNSDASKLDLPGKLTRSKKSLKESSVLNNCDTPFVFKSGNTKIGDKCKHVVDSRLQNKSNSASVSSAFVETAARTTRKRNANSVITKDNDTLTSKVTDFHEGAASPRKLRNSNKCFDKKGEGVLNTLPDVSAKAVRNSKTKSFKQNSLPGQQLIFKQKGPQNKNDSKNKIDDCEAKVSGVFQRKSGRITQAKLSLKESVNDDDDDWEDVSSDEGSDFLMLDSTSLRKCGQAEKVVGEKGKRKEKLAAEKETRKIVIDNNVKVVHPSKDSDPDFEVEMKNLSSDSDETDDWEEIPGKNHYQHVPF